MIKVGVIGYGFSAQTFHLPFIKASELLQLTAISSTKTALLKSHYPQLASYTSAQALIKSNSLDLVVITAPNDVHFSLAEMCLLQGLHVIIEKPMTATSTQAKQLAQLAEQAKLVLSVYHNRRWDGDFLTIKKLF